MQPDHPAFPARWFDGLYVISPGTGLFAPVACELVAIRRLDLSTGRSGPHDFAAASASFVGASDALRRRRGYRISASRVVTIAIRPSHRGGTATGKHDFRKNESEIFSRNGHVSAIGLMELAKIVFRRGRFCVARRARAYRRADPTRQIDLPDETGQEYRGISS